LIPLMIAIDITIIVRVKKNRAKKKLKSEELKEKCKQWKIFHVATGNLTSALQIRAGENVLVNLAEDYLEVLHPNCQVGKGIRYVNSERLRKIAYSLFRKKAKNGVIYITKTALCHLVEIYGLDLPALPFPVPDFIGVSSWYQLARKVLSVGCLGIPLPMLILAQGTASIIISLAAGSFGIVVMAFIKDPGFTVIPTSVIFTSVASIRRRIPDRTDLVSIDLEPLSRSKITVPEFPMGYECSLPDQMMFNPKCTLRPIEIGDIAADGDVYLPFNYDEVVNMRDVTKLPTAKFSDKFDLPTNSEPTTHFSLRGTKNSRNQTQNFLKKYGDPKFVSNEEQWDVTDSIIQDKIRIKDRDL